MARPIVSVIIAAQHEADRVAACFEALARQRSRYPFEVILVDHGSSSEAFRAAAALAKRHKNFSVLRERRAGCAWAYNLGARRARGAVLLFTEVDCVPGKNWVEELARPLLTPQHYPLAAVGGHTRHEYTAGPNFVERYLSRLYAFWERDRLADFPSFLPWAPGINLGVKRDVFLGLGGFDPRWRNAGYDVDFCWRLTLCGFVLGSAPKAELRQVRRSNLRGLARQVENSAFHNQFLYTTYGRLLRLPEAEPHAPRLLRRRQRTPRKVSYAQRLRRLDPLSVAFGLRGTVQTRVLGLRPNPKLRPTRLGRTPARLAKLIPPGYTFLHNQGWAYWKAPANVDQPGELILFRPRHRERFRLDETAWKIWEVKAARGQSEDAALALGRPAHDPSVLHDIDELTLDLRTRHLLP